MHRAAEMTVCLRHAWLSAATVDRSTTSAVMPGCLVALAPTGPITLVEALRKMDLGPVYYKHLVVQKHLLTNTPVRASAIYLDGVPYGANKDTSCMAIYIVDLVTEDRWLVVVVRKEEVCDCGCRGWCTYHCISQMLF